MATQRKFKVQCTSITGVHGRTFKNGEEIPENFLLNIDHHISRGHVTEMVTVTKEVTKDELDAE